MTLELEFSPFATDLVVAAAAHFASSIAELIDIIINATT
jgi:hypothetical protein